MFSSFVPLARFLLYSSSDLRETPQCELENALDESELSTPLPGLRVPYRRVSLRAVRKGLREPYRFRGVLQVLGPSISAERQGEDRRFEYRTSTAGPTSKLEVMPWNNPENSS